MRIVAAAPSSLVALALLQGALLLPIKAFQVPANALSLSVKLDKSSSLEATHRHPNDRSRRRAIFSKATLALSSSSSPSSLPNEDPFVSPQLDTDALVKYALSAITELTLFGVTFQLLDVAQAQLDARLPFPVVAFLFYAWSLKSRVFNPLNNQRPDISKAVEGGGSSGFRDRVMPSWTPPGVIFPIMWLLIIGPIRAYSSAVVVTTVGSFLTLPTMAFILHLTVGDVWNTVNNTEKRYGAAVVGVLCVVLSAANAAYQYSTVDPLAGKLLGGTCLWLVTAAALITDTWRLNPTANGDRVPLYPESSSSSIMLHSSKSVPSSKQNKSRRLVDTVKSPDDCDPKPRREVDTSESNPQKQSEQNQVSQKKKKKPKDTEYQSSVQVQEPARRVIKPGNQLELTKDELDEKITRILTGDDPNKPKNVCKFSFKDRCFKPDPPGQGDNMAIHFSLEGSIMHVDSDECKKYVERVGKPREQEEPDKVTTDGQMTATISSGLPTISITTSNDHAKNQFNFSERASQTFNYPLKSSGVNTEPPPMTQYQDGVSQWRIHDSYKSEFLVSQHIDKQEGSARISFEDKFASIFVAKKDSDDSKADTIHGKSMEHSLKTMERLVNQNAEDEIFHDFKYFEDKADEFRNGEGTLLPLWRFSANRANRKQVTSLCWNPLYNDMFAVGYGSYDFMRQGTGMLCCFSLKNTSHPEYVINTESGVMCLDFHPRHPSLLAVGYYDGMVSAYDISNGTKQPIYSSSLQSGKHSDPVWQVHWHDNGCLSKELNFYSISADGKVANI
ncbi:hypothetical protein ACHAW5_004089 [Stephanodiscus triporus]|uniref:Uncharacterized protein n=1 Tax=Stephanodiscus triporus TaxID=2934178 RepID=A0ABD3PX30_9STRA